MKEIHVMFQGRSSTFEINGTDVVHQGSSSDHERGWRASS